MQNRFHDALLPQRIHLGLAALAGLCGCGESLNPPPESISESLAVLGVNTTKTSRQIDSFNAYPGTHAPLGEVFAFDLEKEIFVGSEDLEVSGSLLLDSYWFADMGASDQPMFGEAYGLLPTTGGPATVLSSDSERYRPKRDWLAGDFDGDSLDEIIALARSGSDVSARLLRISETLDLQDLDLSASIQFGTIHCESGDLDGDGDSEIVVAHSREDGIQEFVHLDFFDWDPEAPATVPGFRRVGELKIAFDTFDLDQLEDPETKADSLRSPWFEFAIGNVDGDLESEVVIAINDNRDLDQSGSDPIELQPASYLVLDDINTAFREIARGEIGEGADIELSRADVTLVNIDGGAEMEIVFGGIDRSYAAEDEASDIATRYAVLSYDLDNSQMIETGSALALHDLGIVSTAAESEYSFHFAHILSGDFDGDGAEEIQLNNATFSPRAQGSGPGSPITWNRVLNQSSGTALELPTEVFQDQNGTQNFSFSRSNSDFGVGDLNGDGADELLTTHYPSNAPFPAFRVFRAEEGTIAGQFSWVQVFAPQQTGGMFDDSSNYPSIFAVDFEGESPRLDKIQGESEVAFTEPLILAAISAPPIHGESTQNPATTTTELGDAVAGLGGDGSIQISVETLVSFEDPEQEADASLFDLIRDQLRPEFIQGGFYASALAPQLTTGEAQDTVLYASIAFDRYLYEVQQYDEKPQLVGSRVVVSIPREPVISSMELQAYNANTIKGMARVDAPILPQSVGSVASYRSRAEFFELVGNNFDQIAPLNVAAVLGSDLVAIQDFRLGAVLGGGGPMTFNQDLSVRGDDGQPLHGFTAGTDENNTLRWGSTSDTTFVGRVGGFGEQNDFLNKYYTWGMGVRLATESSKSQTFLVVDYFVD